MGEAVGVMQADRTDTRAMTEAGQMPAPQGVAFVPGEAVLLLAVAMPEMSLAQRRAAVGFAVEDRIARSLDEVHVMLGPALPDDGGWLVAVIGRDVLAALPSVPKMRLVPDMLALPVPGAGQWAVWAGGDRAVVRTADGAGFACGAGALPYYHLAAGRPDIVLYGGALDGQFPVLRREALPGTLDVSLQRFDLNAARMTGQGFAVPRGWRQTAALLVVAALGHLGLLVADTWALSRMKDAAQSTVREALLAMGQPVGDDLDAAITATLAQSNGAAGPRLIGLLARAFGAMAPQAGRVSASDLRYGAGERTLTLTLQAPDITTLQDVETALVAAGFGVTAGAATTDGGLAAQQLTLVGDGT